MKISFFFSLYFCISLPPSSFAAELLTGAIVFSTTDNGSLTGGYTNTMGGDAYSFNLYVLEGLPPISFSGAFLNSGNLTTAPTRIAIDVSAPGIYDFTMLSDTSRGGASFSQYWGLNLFFEGNDITPRISVYAQPNGIETTFFPTLLENSASATASLDPLTLGTTTGAGTTVWSDGIRTIELTNFRISSESIFNTDRVSGFDLGSNGFTDMVTEFTLVVTAVPEPSIVNSFLYHHNSSFAGVRVSNALDSTKQLAKEGSSPITLGLTNLSNSSRGINGLVFDIHNLPGVLAAFDFEFQVSPTGAFDPPSNPPSAWSSGPAPSSITVVPGSPSRVVITWPDNAISSRWLRTTIKATPNTGLAEPEVYYLGHLLGETTGPADNMFTVSFADITPIRADVGQTVDASSITDIDKNGTVSFADISAMRGNVGSQLTQITVP